MVTNTGKHVTEMTGKNLDIDMKYIGSTEELAESRTIASRKRLQEEVDAEILAFLARGGEIDCIDANVSRDPPKLVNYRYGHRPI